MLKANLGVALSKLRKYKPEAIINAISYVGHILYIRGHGFEKEITSGTAFTFFVGWGLNR
ncbi:MAG: hypothetical protein K2G52_09945 [Muribaculaceae bacterium]|nr:hypothetical protein [Muribaculaceae bacterium]